MLGWWPDRAPPSPPPSSPPAPLQTSQCPLCAGLTVYLAASCVMPCQDKLLCWVKVLVAKQSVLVFNKPHWAWLSVKRADTQVYPISTNEKGAVPFDVLRGLPVDETSETSATSRFLSRAHRVFFVVVFF